MNKIFMVLLCAAGFCCAQLIPSAANSAKVNSAASGNVAKASNASAPAGDAKAATANSIKTLKVKAPVNYDMLVYNGGTSSDYSRNTNASNITPVRRKRMIGSDIAIGTLKFVGASAGALVGAATVGAIVGTPLNVIYGGSGDIGALEEAANDAVTAGAYVGSVIGNAATESFFTDGKEDALRERSLK